MSRNTTATANDCLSRFALYRRKKAAREAFLRRVSELRAANQRKAEECLRYGGNAFGSYAGTVYERTGA